MLRDHAAVNKQALALVKKLKVTPEDNDTSRALTKQAAAKRAEPMLPRRTMPAIVALVALSSVPAHAETIRITMEKLGYAPAEVQAKVGDTVEWINKDILAHTATAKNGDWNVVIAPNKTEKLVLKKAGAVDYYCKYHPNMRARITIAP